MTATESDEGTPKKGKRDRTHWLYLMVIAGVIAGVVLGPRRPRRRVVAGHPR